MKRGVNEWCPTSRGLRHHSAALHAAYGNYLLIVHDFGIKEALSSIRKTTELLK